MEDEDICDCPTCVKEKMEDAKATERCQEEIIEATARINRKLLTSEKLPGDLKQVINDQISYELTQKHPIIQDFLKWLEAIEHSIYAFESSHLVALSMDNPPTFGRFLMCRKIYKDLMSARMNAIHNETIEQPAQTETFLLSSLDAIESKISKEDFAIIKKNIILISLKDAITEIINLEQETSTMMIQLSEHGERLQKSKEKLLIIMAFFNSKRFE